MISNKNEICLWAEIAFKTILLNGIIYLNDFKDLNLNHRICRKRYNLNYLSSVKVISVLVFLLKLFVQDICQCLKLYYCSIQSVSWTSCLDSYKIKEKWYSGGKNKWIDMIYFVWCYFLTGFKYILKRY